MTDVQCHKRTDHVGQGVSTASDLNQPIYPQSGFEGEEGYKKQLEKNWNEIRDKQTTFVYGTDINKELTPEFTYRDLQKLLLEIATKCKTAFKVNIAFGFMLYHNMDDEYRYYYPSSNNVLFDRMITISSRADISKLMKHLIDLDLPENYYMKRPSSGWCLAGLTNVLISALYLNQYTFT